VATKIKLMRLGKMRAPYYRVVVADSRTKRDGRSIETIGKYHPKQDPSLIDIDTERALYWLRVGAQPTEAVAALLKVTGAWQEFKGLPAPEPMKMAAPKVDKRATFEEAARAASGEKEASEAKARPAKKAADKAAKDKAPKPADQVTAEAAAEPTAEPAAEATAEATAEPTPEATAEPTAEPTGEKSE
jgi:small subunit ribosomal protein S16